MQVGSRPHLNLDALTERIAPSLPRPNGGKRYAKLNWPTGNRSQQPDDTRSLKSPS